MAVVGYAFMGKAHSNAWRNVGAFYPGVPPVRQQVLVGRDPAQVKAAADQFGWAGSSTDWRSVLERDDIDIVDLCIPGHLHCELAIAALEAGKHVLAEKPLANTLEEAERMTAAAAAARDRGVFAMVGSTTAACRRWPWPAGWSPRAASAPFARCARRTSRTGWPTRPRR